VIIYESTISNYRTLYYHLKTKFMSLNAPMRKI